LVDEFEAHHIPDRIIHLTGFDGTYTQNVQFEAP
jgi:hypothetical protein